MGHVLLKLTNHSLRSPGIHVTFSQTLSHSLLLSSSLTLKQTFLKSSLKGLIIATRPVPLRLHVIYDSRFKQPFSSVYLTQKLSKYLILQTTRSSTLRIIVLHYKKEPVNLITSRFRGLRSNSLNCLLIVTWLFTRYSVICYSFILTRRPSGQLFKILATTGESRERRAI
jgi:hypothetical protein